MFESMDLQQQGSVYMAHVTTKGHEDVPGLGSLLKPS